MFRLSLSWLYRTLYHSTGVVDGLARLPPAGRLLMPVAGAAVAGWILRATFFYAQVEERGRRLRYVNAGHNPPVLVRSTDGVVEMIELHAGATVLGLFPDIDCRDADIDLRPGDLLVAFTDGATDALNLAGEEFGDQRLKDVLRRAVGASAGEVLERLAGTMRNWIGNAEQQDDVPFLVVAVSAAQAATPVDGGQ